MAQVELQIYQEEDGSAPLIEWLDGLQVRARDRCLARLAMLREHGHELRRPHAEYLEGTDLYELRVKFYRTNYRILYFFHGRSVAVASHGLAKTDKVPPADIKLATERMKKFKANPDRHTYHERE